MRAVETYSPAEISAVTGASVRAVLFHPFRVVCSDQGAVAHQAGDNGQRRGVPHVVGFRLEGQAQHGDGFPMNRATARGNDAHRHAGFSGIIDRDRGFHQAGWSTVILRRADQRQRVLRRRPKIIESREVMRPGILAREIPARSTSL